MSISIDFFTPFQLLNSIVLTVGLWKLLPKCGVDKRWSLVPFLRFFKCAQASDREDSGFLWLFSYISTILLQFTLLLFGDLIPAPSLTPLLVGLILALTLACMVYEIRIYFGLCHLFGKSKLWVIAWVLCSAFPAIVWGFSKKVPPAYDRRRTGSAAPLSDQEVQAADTGLSINLKSRHVLDFPLRRRYLLRDIHMNIQPGHMVLLLGGSGAGKTTFVNAVIGYEKGKAKILLNGVDVYKHYRDMLYDIGLVPQQDLMRSTDTVTHTLADAARLRMPTDISDKERTAKVKEVLTLFGLDTVAESEVVKLSGGQRKRLSIAMEYIADPYLFVLDEPDSGLDGVMARQLMERLHAIAREGRIVLVITHSPDRVADLFDDVIVLAKDASQVGRLAYFGPIDKAREFFGKDRMEHIVKVINPLNEGGEGRADEMIQRFAEERHAAV